MKETKFIIVTGGTDLKSNENTLKSSQLKEVLFKKNELIIIVKLAENLKGFEEEKELINNRPIILEHDLNVNEWRKTIAKKYFHKHKENSSTKGKIEEIKKQLIEIERIRQPDFMLIEIKNNLIDVKNFDLIQAVKELVQELGKERFTFIHIESTPHLNKTEKELEKNRGKQFLEITGIKPNIIVRDYELIWRE